MTLNRCPAYTEVVTHGDDTPVVGAVTAHQADRIIAAALRRGYDIEPTAQGVIVLRRTCARVVVELHPAAPPTLSPTQARDLALVAGKGSSLRISSDGLVISAGISRVPPAFARRLIERGWVSCLTLADGEPVSVSVAGTVAVALHQHTTRTRQPRGWHYPADNPYGPQMIGRDRHGGRIYDGTSTAICSCGWSQPADRRPAAATAAKQHRIEMLAVAVTARASTMPASTASLPVSMATSRSPH